MQTWLGKTAVNRGWKLEAMPKSQAKKAAVTKFRIVVRMMEKGVRSRWCATRGKREKGKREKEGWVGIVIKRDTRVTWVGINT